jgi:hypothetical protein
VQTKNIYVDQRLILDKSVLELVSYIRQVYRLVFLIFSKKISYGVVRANIQISFRRYVNRLVKLIISCTSRMCKYFFFPVIVAIDVHLKPLDFFFFLWTVSVLNVTTDTLCTSIKYMVYVT